MVRKSIARSVNPNVARHLQELEKLLLNPDVRKSNRVLRLVADEFVEFGSSGRVYDKSAIVAALKSETPVRVTATRFKIQLLAPGAALVTYLAHRRSTPPVRSWRSSIWQRRGRDWQMVFHQGTIARTPR